MAMSTARKLGTLVAMILLIVATAACGPSGPGDACDIEDGCPDNLVCAAGTKGNICFNPHGGECNPKDPDFCLGDATCVNGKCLVPIGGKCDPKTMPDACVGDNNVCGDVGDGTGTGICGIPEGGVCDPLMPQCAGGLTCAELKAGGNKCYRPVIVTGLVFDSATMKGIIGAHVIALDDHAVAITDVAVTDMMGNYKLNLPVPRNDDGSPVLDLIFTLRASGPGYQTFPGGLRTALPISTAEIMPVPMRGWTINTTLTTIALIALPSAELGQTISGKVVADGVKAAGVLVVAENIAGKGISAISDRTGAYTIFNIPDGGYTVRGYAAGLQLTPVMAMMAGKPLTGIDLTTSANALGKVSGSVNIVNAPGGSATSVVLVVASTFSDTFVRGEVPRGLRTPLTGPPNVTGSFTIDMVPEGTYKVLAAFENDGLVRDPDPNIAGTQVPTVTIPDPMMTTFSFKVTAALETFGPGVDKPEAVTSAPNLRWADDSSEVFYTLVVYNAFGDRVWCLADGMMPACDGPNIPAMNGVTEVSVPYGGPLDAGMYYQFRATAWRMPGGMPGPISNTEDLRGVFYVAGK